MSARIEDISMETRAAVAYDYLAGIRDELREKNKEETELTILLSAALWNAKTLYNVLKEKGL